METGVFITVQAARSDPETDVLTDIGEKQAVNIARKIRDEIAGAGIVVILTSPARSAMETANVIQQFVRCEHTCAGPVYVDSLRSENYECGKDQAKIVKKFLSSYDVVITIVKGEAPSGIMSGLLQSLFQMNLVHETIPKGTGILLDMELWKISFLV